MKRWKRFWHGLVVETLATVGLFMVIGGSLSGEALHLPSHAQNNRIDEPTQRIVDPITSPNPASPKAEHSTARQFEQWLSALVHIR